MSLEKKAVVGRGKALQAIRKSLDFILAIMGCYWQTFKQGEI